jgi:hypothetical protein
MTAEPEAKPDALPEAKPDQPDPISVMVAGLIHNLGRLLLSLNKSPNEDGSEDIITLQARHVAAQVEVAKFLAAAGKLLGVAGTSEDISSKFLGLADAIGNLRNGTVADVVRPTLPGGQPDGLVVWSLRNAVVKGLECFVKSGTKFKTRKEAAEYIANKYPVFERLKHSPRDFLPASISSSWRRHINDGDVPEAESFLADQRRFFEQHLGDNRSPAEKFATGEQLLAEAAELTTKAVF